MRRFLGAGTLVMLLLRSAAAAEWIVEGRVVSVADGDTFTLLDSSKTQHRVRIGGIDAPEKGQPFGDTAKERLSTLVYGKQIRARCWKHDQYGREVCAASSGPRDLGLEMIREGLAWHYKRFEQEQDIDERRLYSEAETMARRARRGLWKIQDAVPPWEWRAKHSTAGSTR